jgi:hypothetical protein
MSWSRNHCCRQRNLSGWNKPGPRGLTTQAAARRRPLNKLRQNSAKDIVFESRKGKTHVYVSNPDYSVDFLDDEGLPDTYGTYIGSLTT